MIPFFYISSLVLLPSPAAISVLSFFCFWPVLLICFSLTLHFLKGRLFCVALAFIFFERLDEYFSWYVQPMLPYGTGISLYAFIYVGMSSGGSGADQEQSSQAFGERDTSNQQNQSLGNIFY